MIVPTPLVFIMAAISILAAISVATYFLTNLYETYEARRKRKRFIELVKVWEEAREVAFPPLKIVNEKELKVEEGSKAEWVRSIVDEDLLMEDRLRG